jgi:hypothetical protein
VNRLVPLDRAAVEFRHDMESMRATAVKIFGHPARASVSRFHFLDLADAEFCELEEETWFDTGICPSHALWPDDIAGQAITAWKQTGR